MILKWNFSKVWASQLNFVLSHNIDQVMKNKSFSFDGFKLFVKFARKYRYFNTVKDTFECV